MYLHANAKLGLAGRLAMVRAVEDGLSLKAAAVVFSVSPATVHRWWHRWLDGGREAGALLDRSSRPSRSPRLLAAELEERICDCRRQTGWGPRLVAAATGFAHSTVWKVLHRNGLSPRRLASRDPANSYEWPCPGDLLHMDTSRYARFLRPGHRVTGDRSQSLRGRSKETLVGYDFAHAIVDDRSRLAYVELHDDEKAATVTGFVERALAFFAAHGIGAKRLMTDNAFSYVNNRSLRELLAHNGIRHLRTKPYRPRTNGKVERFHQTMAREWARRDSATAHIDNATRPCHTGSTTTTTGDHTARSETNPRSAAFTTSVGRTPSHGCRGNRDRSAPPATQSRKP